MDESGDGPGLQGGEILRSAVKMSSTLFCFAVLQCKKNHACTTVCLTPMETRTKVVARDRSSEHVVFKMGCLRQRCQARQALVLLHLLL
jgi:hypothetical protein